MSKQEEKKIKPIDETSSRLYTEEHHRLEEIVRESEKIWEDRTFGIAAGGLSLSFALFSFLVSQGVIQRITVGMLLIWFGYVACLSLNYWIHHKTINDCLQLQQDLSADRNQGLPYDASRLSTHYEKANKQMKRINCITEVLLFVSVIATLLYTFFSSIN